MNKDELIKTLMNLVSKKIQEINYDGGSVYEFEALSKKLEGVITLLETDPLNLEGVNVKEFIDIISAYIKEDDLIYNPDKIQEILTGLQLPLNAIPYAKLQGHFYEDEREQLEKFIELLKYTKDSINATKESHLEKIQNSDEVILYSIIYDGLNVGDKGLVLFDEEELRGILELVKDKDLDFKVEVIALINDLNNRINQNKLRSISNVSSEDEEEEETVKNYDFDYDALNQILVKHGFPDVMRFQNISFVKKYVTGFRLQKILDIINYLVSEPKYDFLIHPNLIDLKYIKKLFGVFRYSNVAILKSLASQEVPGIDTEMIFDISGVYRRVSKTNPNPDGGGEGPGTDKDDEPGTYDYFINNKRFLDKLSNNYNLSIDPNNQNPQAHIDLYSVVFNNNKDLLVIPSDVFQRNINLLLEYGLMSYKNFNPNTRIYSTTLKDNIDRLIECGLYDTLKSYPSTMSYSSAYTYLLVQKHQQGVLNDFVNSNNTIKELRHSADNYIFGSSDYKKLEASVHNNKLDAFNAGINPGIMAALDDYPKQCATSTDVSRINDVELNRILNSYAVSNNTTASLYTLLVNGVIISRNKFIKNWLIISNTNLPISYSEKLLLAATHGSLYSPDEIDRLIIGFGIDPKLLLGNGRV